MVQTGIFNGRTRVRYGYARWGWTRGGGKTWHGGIDLEALDDTTRENGKNPHFENWNSR